MDRQLQGELEKIVASLRTYCKSEANANDPDLAKFCDTALDIDKAHNYLNEVEHLIEISKGFALTEVKDLNPSFEAIQKGQTWEISDFLSLNRLLKAGDEVYDKLAKQTDCPLLADLALDIKFLPDLERAFEYSFSPEGEVLDTASGQLMSIRKELRQTLASEMGILNRAKQKYKSALALPDPVVRNGRETLAVDAGKKGEVPGIVIDRSKTGETLFVLPYELLEIENKKEKLYADEKGEIDRILEKLTKDVYSHLPEIERNYYSYNQIDIWFSKANFGNSYDGCVATTAPDSFALENFIHPLIDLEKAVPNSLHLGKGSPRILVISGPNAGGKSVMLKALALACLMNQMGLLVPARKAELPVFDSIQVLTGDSESLAGNLSSFSGHLKGLKEMYETATGRSFVLVDEIGQGTAPEDGEALGYAFIKHIENIRAFGIFTTHYDGLKKMAADDENIMSGAMEFSTDNLRPTFRFLAGGIGNSYAFEVAAQSGIPQEMLEEAKAYKAGHVQFDLEKLESDLTARIQKTKYLEKTLNDRLAEANRLIEKRNSAVKALQEQKDNIAKKADLKVEKMAQERIAQLDELWKQGQNKKLPFNEQARLKGLIRQAGQKPAEESENNGNIDIEEFKPGDVVVYQNMTGILDSVSKNKAKFIYNNITFTVNLSDIRHSDVSKLKVRPSTSNIDNVILSRANHAPTRLNIIGMTVAEAIPVVEKFISDALVAHMSQVTIVHGMGTFALRNGVREHLKHMKDVKSFREAGEGEGAMGATVVTLR